MSDTTARTALIRTQADRIEQLEEEKRRLEKGERPRMATLKERLIEKGIFVAILLLLKAVGWVSDAEVAKTLDGLEGAAVYANEQRVEERERGDYLYDTASDILIESAEQGCEVEVK